MGTRRILLNSSSDATPTNMPGRYFPFGRRALSISLEGILNKDTARGKREGNIATTRADGMNGCVKGGDGDGCVVSGKSEVLQCAF